jgi:hypothetical protein
VKEFIIPVNNEAHSRALETIVGPETAQLVLKAYKAIDSAMVFGYERGTRDTLASTAEEAAESREKFSEGYDAGYSKALTAHSSSYDAGYEAGFEKGTCEGYTDGHSDGYDAGYSEAYTTYYNNNYYDDGYVDGVQDARLCPDLADEEVARLCGDDEFDESNISDSGDVSERIFNISPIPTPALDTPGFLG